MFCEKAHLGGPKRLLRIVAESDTTRVERLLDIVLFLVSQQERRLERVEDLSLCFVGEWVMDGRILSCGWMNFGTAVGSLEFVNFAALREVVSDR